MLDRLRCRYGRYICTVRLKDPSMQQIKSEDSSSSSSSSGSGSSIGGTQWKVSIEKELGESMRRDLINGIFSSPQGSINVKEESEFQFQSPSPQTPTATPRVSRKRELQSKSPLPEPTLVHHIFEFPTIAALSLATETELRALGMGYRAKFISGSAQFLASKEEGGNAWLQQLRDLSGETEMINEVATKIKIKSEIKGEIVVKEELTVKKRSKSEIKVEVKVESSTESKLLTSAAIQMARRMKNNEVRGSNRMYVQTQLMQMPGVGKKVADCVALFSLDQVESIPVDTHVWDIALRDYDPSLSLKGAKSITPTVYEEVGEVFRDRFPLKAGWAHSVLFAAELPEFRQRLPIELQNEMKAFIEQNKSVKRAESTIKLEKRRAKKEEEEEDEEEERDEVLATPLSGRSRSGRRSTPSPSPATVTPTPRAKSTSTSTSTPSRSSSSVKRVKVKSER